MSQEYCPYCMNPVEPDKPCQACGLTAGAYTSSAHHLPPGTVLRDRYLVGRVLGEGGFGITYIGCDLQLELKVAIKEYFPTDRSNRVASAGLMVSSYTGSAGAGYESDKERFLKEARTMAMLDKQPVIVTVRDFFKENNTAYIVMEYVEGTTLKDLTAQRGGRMAAGELLHMIEPLFSALSGMHQKGLIHRDISPENLILENGNIRLLDFGCARESAAGDSTLTIMLKHGFAPVEQYQSKGQGPWTDVYALSATIYYCLTGVRPPQAMDRLVEDELTPPRKLGADLTQRQEQALLHGMGLRPRKRFQSIEELHTALYEGGPLPEVQVHLEADMTAEPGRAGPGAEVTFLLKVRNTGASTAVGASVRPSLPKGLTMVQVKENDRAVQADSRSYSLRDIAPGGGTVMAMTARVEDPPGDMLAFSAAVDCPGLEQPIRVQAAVELESGGISEDITQEIEENRGKTGWPAWAKAHGVQLAAGAGALLLVLALLIWRPWSGTAPGPAPIDPVSSSEPAGISSETSSDASSDPSPVSGTESAGDEDTLHRLLEDDSVAAVTIDVPEEMGRLTVYEPLVLTKPLLVKTSITLNAPLTVDGGELLVEGAVYGDTLIHTRNGGSITLSGDGLINIGGLLWTDREDDLRYENSLDECEFQRLTVDEDELFKDAVRVGSADEFEAACSSGKPIIVEKSFRLDSGAYLSPQSDLLIEEGVEVELGWDDTLNDPGHVLINRGTLSGRVHLTGDHADSTLINYGTLDAA